MFDQKIAQQKFEELIARYKITVKKYRKSSCGCAYPKTRQIEVPRIIDVDTFCVCMHEIKHIYDGEGYVGRRFIEEFNADIYAMEQADQLGFDTTDWIRRTNIHTLISIAKAHNRGLNHKNIPDYIKSWFVNVDFNEWLGKKVFVSWNRNTELGYNITLVKSMKLAEVRIELFKRELRIEISRIDDSTYGKYIVTNPNDYEGLIYDFDNLTQVIEYYQL